jgi:hypothetical protein
MIGTHGAYKTAKNACNFILFQKFILNTILSAMYIDIVKWIKEFVSIADYNWCKHKAFIKALW